MEFEGQNISLSDALFVDNVTGDLENWRIKSEAIERVLVFPPVNNYHRFLIHKVGDKADMRADYLDTFNALQLILHHMIHCTHFPTMIIIWSISS